MKILIIDQCSGSKEYPGESPVFSAEEIDTQSRKGLLEQDGVAKLKARKLYSGRQQQYISEAVDLLRETGHVVDRYFISAGFGLVEEDEKLPPYEATFNGMSKKAIQDRADKLEIPTSTHKVLSKQNYDIVFFALGEKYYRSIEIEKLTPTLAPDTWGVLFNQEELADSQENIISIPARTEEAKKRGTIVVALKGTYLKNFADHLSQEVPSKIEEVEDFCTSETTTQWDFDRF